MAEYLHLKQRLERHRPDKRPQRLLRRLRGQLSSQRAMIEHIDMYEEPRTQADDYFDHKVRNYYLAQKMEDSVNNV